MDESSVGQSKAKCVCAFLQELNDAVKAKFIEESPETLIETNPSFFKQFTIVVATQVWDFVLIHFIQLGKCFIRWFSIGIVSDSGFYISSCLLSVQEY